jgi:Sugar phosphate isomerases/epimerases
MLTFSSLACPAWTIEEIIAAAVRYGYQGIEWRMADGEIIDSSASADVRRRLRAVPEANGIAIVCLDTSCQVVQGNAEGRASVIEEGQRMIDLAAAIGAPRVRVFGGELPKGATRAEVLRPSAEILQELGNYASTCGVTVVLETHDVWSKSADVKTLMREVASPAVKVLWDANHTYRSGETPAQSLELIGDELSHVHIKDSQLTVPGEWKYCLIGEGDVPLHDICQQLKKHGYDGPLSFEWEKKWHPTIAEPDVALPQAASALRAIWQEA